MKKLAFILFSCAVLNAQSIGVSIKPIEYLINQILPSAKTTVLVDERSNPHNFELKAQKILELNKNDVFFAIGVEAEAVWLEKLKQNTNIKIIDITSKIKKIKYENIHEHEHEHEHEHSGIDVHIWTSIENLTILSQNIAKNLKNIYPKNSLQIDTNLKILLTKLKDLNQQIKTQTKDLKTRTFISSHPAWAYFAKEFNLKEYSLEFEGKELKIKELKKMIDLANENKACLLITSALFNTKSINLLKQQSNLKLVNINALNYNILDEILNFAKILHNNCSN